MRKFLFVLVVALLLGAAVAAELPRDGDIVLTAEGEVVGTGEFEDGNLELELLTGFEGTATFTVVDDEGNEYSFDVQVDSEGSVVLDGTSEDLEEVVEEDGGEVVITFREELETEGNMAFGAAVPDHVDLPDVAREGMERAKENHEEAKERSGAGASVEGRAEGEAHGEAGGEEAEAEAEADVSLGVGLGKGEED
ncbi:MAG TPA: hypothetical protein VF168_00015 [Trueperaceae bacterium]